MERFYLAEKLIRDAGSLLAASVDTPLSPVQKTGHQDLVTKYDKMVEQFLRAELGRRFPEDSFVGEEFPCDHRGQVVWYLDPIDGTTNFISQQENYAVSIACYKCGVPLFGMILDVKRALLYSARRGCGAFCGKKRLRAASMRTDVHEMLLTTSCIQHTFLRSHAKLDSMLRLAEDVRGIRSLGAVSLELCSIAAGRADVFVALHSSPWDHNAARVIVSEAGGIIEALSGGDLPIDAATPVIACNCVETLMLLRDRYFRQE